MISHMNEEEWRESVEWVGIVAGCVLEKDGKYLLVQEKQQKVYGLWNLPAGYVDRGETIVQAALREVKEEVGYVVEIDEELGVFHEAVGKPVKHAFRAHIVGGDLAIQENEILDAKWFTYDEITSLNTENKLRANWIWESVKKIHNK